MPPFGPYPRAASDVERVISLLVVAFGHRERQDIDHACRRPAHHSQVPDSAHVVWVTKLVHRCLMLGRGPFVSVEGPSDAWVPDRKEVASINPQSSSLASVLHHVVLEPPPPEVREPACTLEIPPLYRKRSPQSKAHTVIVSHHPRNSLIGELATVPGTCVDIVKDECDIAVVVRVALSHHQEPDVLHRPPVERSSVALVDEKHFPVIFSLQEGVEALHQFSAMRLSISIRDDEDAARRGRRRGHCTPTRSNIPFGGARVSQPVSAAYFRTTDIGSRTSRMRSSFL